MKKEPIIVNVYLWGTCIGKLNWDFEKHCSVFQFTLPASRPKNWSDPS